MSDCKKTTLSATGDGRKRGAMPMVLRPVLLNGVDIGLAITLFSEELLQNDTFGFSDSSYGN